MGILAISADERVRDARVSEDTLTVDLKVLQVSSDPTRSHFSSSWGPLMLSANSSYTKVSANFLLQIA